VDLFSLERLPWNWKAIEIEGEPGDIFPVLDRIESLREVKVISATMDPGKPLSNSLTTDASLSWKMFSTNRIDTYTLSFLHRLTTSLSNFSFSGTISQIFDAARLLWELTQLDVLSLDLVPGAICDPPSNLVACSARKLIIRAYRLLRSQPELLMALWKVFPAVTPMVRRFSIISHNGDFAFLRTSNLEYLESLTLQSLIRRNFSPPALSEEVVILPTSLIHVRTHLRNYDFHNLISTSAKCLDINGYGATANPVDTRHLQQWTNLRSLTMDCVGQSFGNFSLPHLSKLVLIEHEYKPGDSCTHFCQQLALSVHNCPALQHVSFNICPEWDILIEMLERRNFIQDQGIARIVRVDLPTYCPRRIRRLMIELVQGRRVVRPSNYELSLVANIDVLCDPSM